MSERLRYKAFISYSHRDSRMAVWLHRRLESWRVPRALRSSDVPERLSPVFRDRDELASAAALSDSIQAALDASAALVVLCSPAAAQSRWVNEEIRYFRRTHPQRKLLAFIVDGDPGADPASAPERACFPPCLIQRDIEDPDAGTIEPAAPDARKDADGREAAFLKLAAGLLDLPFDKLRQRELRRQQQRWMIVGAGSLALSAVFAVLAWQAIIARDAARVAQARAELEADTARQTSEFMVSLFEVSEPGEARGNTITAREVLDRGVERIESTTIAKPVVKSRLLDTMGRVYAGLGLYGRARELLALAENVVPGDATGEEEITQRFEAQLEQADLLYVMGEYEPAAAVLERIGTLPVRSARDAWRNARLANVRGDLAFQTGDDDAARLAWRTALAALDTPGADDPVERARATLGLGQIDLYAGRFAEADRLFDSGHALLLAEHGADHPDVLWAKSLQARSAYSAGDRARAEQQFLEALAIGQRIYGERHPEVGTFLNNVAVIRMEACRFDEAEPMLRRSLDIDRNVRKDGFDDLAYTLNSLALTRIGQGAPADALPLLEEARQIAAEHQHRMQGPILNNLADFHCAEGRAATDIAAAALAASEAEYGAEHWRTQQAVLTAAYCAGPDATSDHERLLQALESIRAQWGTENLYTQRALQQLAALAARRGERAEQARLEAAIIAPMRGWMRGAGASK